VPRKGLVEKFNPLRPVPLEPELQQRTGEIPDIALIHQREAGVLIQHGTQQRRAGTKNTNNENWIF
jgi:hypothetical protein